VIAAINEASSETPDLFILLCAITKASEVPVRVTIAPLWFFFPLQLFLRSPPEVRSNLGAFLAFPTVEHWSIRQSVLFSLLSGWTATAFSLPVSSPRPLPSVLRY
jgi:hypothetical protein